MYLVLDTETTGLGPDARLVQLAWQLIDHDGRLSASCNTLIIPEGFRIPEEATRVHGITTEQAATGLPVMTVLDVLACAVRHSETIVGHNLRYDLNILNREFRRPERLVPWTHWPQFDTMLRTVELCKLPNPRGFSEYKWPKLAELHRVLFAEDFPAHDAAADVAACARCYLELRRRGLA